MDNTNQKVPKHHLRKTFITLLPAVRVQSIAISVTVCLSVCVSVSLLDRSHISKAYVQISQNFLYVTCGLVFL